jgi:DNA polymerase IIIc chi subunit
MQLKKTILAILLLTAVGASAQTVDSIYVNLYTDSLKKGTHNYINVDGLLSNGRYLPLDSTHLIFEASSGKFVGNSLWIDRNTTEQKVRITVTLRRNKQVSKSFDIYIKQQEATEQLKTADEIINGMQNNTNTKKKRRSRG